MLNSIKISPLSGRLPQQAVIYLHGATRRASDIANIATALMPALPDAVFLAPTGPLLCEGPKTKPLSSGLLDRPLTGHLWYPIDNFSPPILYPRIKENAPALHNYLDQVGETYQLGPHQIALVGMSQGTMIGLYVGFRRALPVAGILGFSGAFLDMESISSEGGIYPPVFLVHGTKDDQVPFSRMREAQQAILEIGGHVETLALPGLGHTIEARGLAHGARFLRRVFRLAEETKQRPFGERLFRSRPSAGYKNMENFLSSSVFIFD